MNSIALILFALGWSALPLIPALRELYRPTDAKALDVFQGNAADASEPLHAALRLKAAPEFNAKAALAQTGTLVADAQSDWQALTGEAKAVLLQGVARVDSLPGQLQAFRADRVEVAPGAQIAVPLSASQAVTLSNGSSVRMVQAPVVAVLPVTGEPRQLAEPAADQGKGSVGGATWQDLQGWWHAEADAFVVTGQVIRGDILVAGNLDLGPGVVVTGSVKAAGQVRMGAGSTILGNCVATSIEVQAHGAVRGSVVADERIQLGKAVQVGDVLHPASVVAKDITLAEGVCIHGGLTAHRSADVQA